MDDDWARARQSHLTNTASWQALLRSTPISRSLGASAKGGGDKSTVAELLSQPCSNVLMMLIDCDEQDVDVEPAFCRRRARRLAR